MIAIKGSHIEAAAEWWAETLINFLTEKHKGKHRPHYKYKKKTKSFDTRLDKYKSLFFDLCKEKEYRRVPLDERNKICLEIDRFLADKKNLIGNKTTMEKILIYHRDNIIQHPLLKVIQSVFVEIYKEFTKEHAYTLLSKLKIRTCPYCNRNYTVAVKEEEDSSFSTRPEFDHFHNKSSYPFLAVTFYNLVPSCATCNHGKGVKEAGINPYFEGFKTKFVLSADMSTNGESPKPLNRNEILKLKDEDKFEVVLDSPTPHEAKNIKVFGLEQLYGLHKDYVQELIEKTIAYDKLTNEGIVERFQGIVHSPEEIRNIIFGKYISDMELSIRPFSKLTRDILEQSGFNIS